MSLENPLKIAKKDGHLHEISKRNCHFPYLVILCQPSAPIISVYSKNTLATATWVAVNKEGEGDGGKGDGDEGEQRRRGRWQWRERG
jgi:hypothetical protein